MLNKLHAEVLSKSLESVLGSPEVGSVAFVSCLTGDIIDELAGMDDFHPRGWQVRRVADTIDNTKRTITADRAVEMRESKGNPVLLLVDTLTAGAGMDGIYSAARKIQEEELFSEAVKIAAKEVTKRLSSGNRKFADEAMKKARRRGRRVGVSRWAEFDFLVRSAFEIKHPGALLNIIGLWPVKQDDDVKDSDSLEISLLFINHFMGSSSVAATPAARIDGLRMLNLTNNQRQELETFLHTAATMPLLPALAILADRPGLWINALQIDIKPSVIKNIEIIPWKTRTGQLARWSGLTSSNNAEKPPFHIYDGLDRQSLTSSNNAEKPPAFILRPDAEKTGQYSKIEVQWKSIPQDLEKGCVEYRVAVFTDMDEELTSKDVTHTAKDKEKCKFTNDDFSSLNEDALIPAKIIISIIGKDAIQPAESEEFIICFGEPPQYIGGGVGKKVRTFSEGLIELTDRENIPESSSANINLSEDSKGFIVLRTKEKGKTYRVFRPSLIKEIDQRWMEKNGAIGRWRVKVRASGARAGAIEFVPFGKPDFSKGTLWENNWTRTEAVTRKMAERVYSSGGSVAQVYDEQTKGFESVVREYLLAWAAMLESTQDPSLALVNTVEIQTLSGRTIGLIVLPTHPLRVAWNVAFDNLVFDSRFEQLIAVKNIRQELSILDGAMFPAFLPGISSDSTFVFADTLGFHAVGMVLDIDKEPKAAIALMARALGDAQTADASPTVGKQCSAVLGREILKYLECHDGSKMLHIHALRPGDGLTIARSLGEVRKYYGKIQDDEWEEKVIPPNFILELYPSDEQRAVSGRFIAETCEKRRSGSGVLSEDDIWMLESRALGSGLSIPSLRWARRDIQKPDKPAHIAAAFDTFDSRVVTIDTANFASKRPLMAFGLLSYFDRSFKNIPGPIWLSTIPQSLEGEKHPSDRTHTDRLLRIQQLINRLVSKKIDDSDLSRIPVLRTEISSEKADDLQMIHNLCDWVITVDRNAGIEYFDSPINNKEIYDAYVIDCVPEREDLGCLQLITSTSNVDEVRNLFDNALGLMGLSHSRRNAEFLLENLKALSGHLAIRLTGNKTITSELIALAIFNAHSRKALDNSESWVSLKRGFFIPVDDVQDILPQLVKDQEVNMRPDLIHVSVVGRRGLLFRFIEVKYRKHLRTARDPGELTHIHEQVDSIRSRWYSWYINEDLPSTIRSIRRAKLARVLRFYADKASRHYLDESDYKELILEIDRMLSIGSAYSFGSMERPDRGFIFCPEYGGSNPLEISPRNFETRIFLFGPNLLPDSYYQQFDTSSNQVSIPQVLPFNATENNNEKNTFVVDLHSPANGLSADQSRAVDNDLNKPENCTKNTQTSEIFLGTDILTNMKVNWELTIKGNPHLMVVGLPGMGKTTCLINICKQMLQNDVKPIVFSYHQDIDEHLESIVGSVRYIDFRGLGFNPLQVLDRESGHGYLDVAGSLRDIFMAIYPELGDIQGERIRQAIKDSFVEMGWGSSDINNYDIKEPEFKRFIEILRDHPKPDRGQQTLLVRLEELADYGFFDLSERQESLWQSEVPVVVRVHTTQNDNLQRAFASLIFYGLYKDMFRRGIQSKLTHSIIFDEAHRAASMKLIPTMAKECRKYGISLVLASQEARDFHISLYSAIANYLVLRLTDVDARALVRNVASSDQEKTLIDRIKQLERFKALYFREGKKKPAYILLSQ